MKNIKNIKSCLLPSFCLIPIVTGITIGSAGGGYLNSNTNNLSNYSIDLNDSSNIVDVNDTSKWTQTIKESSDTKNVKVFFSRNATIAFQMQLIATNYMLQNNPNRYSNVSTTDNFDEIVWFVDYDLYQNKKYNFDYYNNTYGPVFDQNTNQYNPSGYNFSLYSRITNNGFDNLTDDNNTEYQYSVTPTEKQLGYFMDFYTKKYGENVKFDLWVPEISLVSMWSNGIQSQTTSNFYNLIKHTNKINVVSDGNWQTLNLVTNQVNRLNSKDYSQMSIEQMKQNFDKFKNDSENKYYSEFKNKDIYDYLHYSDLITIFHIKSYSSSPYYKYPSNMKLYDVYSVDYDYSSMANKFFANDRTKKDSFITDFETFFNIQNNKSINDFVWKNIENYDPKKKNIIWMGDSLIRPDSNGNEIYRYQEKQYEINKIIESYTKKYPLDQYNYFIKHHPSFSHEYQENLTNYIFKDIVDPIYMTAFPWELFLSWDNKMQQESANNGYVGFFNASSNNDQIPQTTLVGIQYTTTTIQTTAFYLQNTYNMSVANVDKSVGIKNFPIPMYFDITTRTTGFYINPYEQYNINSKKVIDIYEPFYQLNVFGNYKADMISTEDYTNSNDVSFEVFTPVTKNEQTLINKNNVETIILIVISVLLACSLASTIVFATLFFKKRKLNK